MVKDNKELLDANEVLNKYLKNVNETDLAFDDFLIDSSFMLRRFRLSKGLTQSEAAKLFGVKQAMISKLEGGDYNPSIGVLWKYLHSIGGEIKLIFSSTDEKSRPSFSINEEYLTDSYTGFDECPTYVYSAKAVGDNWKE